jgi:hypothetical protein
MDRVGEGVHALRAASSQYPGEGQRRERDNASKRKYRLKSGAEEDASFPEIELEDEWVCNYCTNINPDLYPRCEVCQRPKNQQAVDTRWVCNKCKQRNKESLPQCTRCRKPQETTV